VLRTGMQWNALSATGICSSSSAHWRFQEWTEAGVFEQFWRRGLLKYDELKGIDWEWLALDGAIGKAPLGGEQTGASPTDRAKSGRRSRFEAVRASVCEGGATVVMCQSGSRSSKWILRAVSAGVQERADLHFVSALSMAR
jgi:transposase